MEEQSPINAEQTADEGTRDILLENWFDDVDLHKEEAYRDYWNDEEAEREKDWDVANRGFQAMENHVLRTGLAEDLRRSLEELESRFHKHPTGIALDLACGTCWAVPVLLKLHGITKLYCVEYSRHRLLKVGTLVLRHYGVDLSKVVLAMGSFYRLRLRDNEAGFVLMSQAFHHADRPLELLRELKRVLRPGGCAVIIGEHRVRLARTYVRHVVKRFVGMFPRSAQIGLFGRAFSPETFPLPHETDPLKGDHYYRTREYRQMFDEVGFQWARVSSSNAECLSFVLVNRS